jgi:hypothetical protein
MLRSPSQSSAGIWALLADLLQALLRALVALAGQWLLLLCLIAMLALLWVYASSGRGHAVRRLWLALRAALGRYLRLLYAVLFTTAGIAAARVGKLAARAPARAGTALRQLRGPDLGSMPARQAVVALYLAALRQASRRGFARRTGQTPSEYARALAAQVPEAGDAAEELTETFVVARYGAEPVDAADVEHARTLRQRLRLALRGRRARVIPPA